jgi:Ca2+-binding EF-hand superfamily protein
MRGRFRTLFEKINRKLDREQIEFIFNLIDEDHTNTIELREFEKWLKQNNVRMNHGPALRKQKTITEKTPKST